MTIKSFIMRSKYKTIDILTKRRFFFPPELSNTHNLSNSISIIRKRWPDVVDLNKDIESPVFIFSAGWRSGSTLLQRLLCSSNQITVWGEPLGDAAFIARLAYSLNFITASWPPENFFAKNITFSELSNNWIANLTPDIRYLHSAHRAFFEEWFKKSVQERFGIDRWGIKEVRLTIDHARYLKWLFPRARFLFIYRNPYNAYRSWKGNEWRSVWPGYHSNSALAFARHWKLLMNGFLGGVSDIDGLMIKFEDLIGGKFDLNLLANYVGLDSLDSYVLLHKINDPHRIVVKKQISNFEKMIIFGVCKKVMRQVGYV